MGQHQALLINPGEMDWKQMLADHGLSVVLEGKKLSRTKDAFHVFVIRSGAIGLLCVEGNRAIPDSKQTNTVLAFTPSDDGSSELLATVSAILMDGGAKWISIKELKSMP